MTFSMTSHIPSFKEWICCSRGSYVLWFKKLDSSYPWESFENIFFPSSRFSRPNWENLERAIDVLVIMGGAKHIELTNRLKEIPGVLDEAISDRNRLPLRSEFNWGNNDLVTKVFDNLTLGIEDDQVTEIFERGDEDLKKTCCLGILSLQSYLQSQVPEEHSEYTEALDLIASLESDNPNPF